jgi:hypothetical protein
MLSSRPGGGETGVVDYDTSGPAAAARGAGGCDALALVSGIAAGRRGRRRNVV